MAQSTQDLRKANDDSAVKGEKIAPVKQASLADCVKQFQSTLKGTTPAKPAAEKPAPAKPV